MRLVDRAAEVLLVPTGWEFAEHDSSQWNWLVVDGHVTANGRSWEFTNVLFTPSEGLMLADWLEQIVTLQEGSSFSFTEPEVSFERGRSLPGAHVELRVDLVYEAAPPWVDAESGSEFQVIIAIDAAEAKRAASVLRREVRQITAR